MDRDTVIEQGLALAHEQGLDALSLRTLATRLGVKAPSLYWHVANKGDLLAAMGERLLWDCLGEIPEVSTWQDWLRAYGRQLWLTQSTFRDSGQLLMALRSNAVGCERVNAEITSRLGAFGVPPDNARVMQWSVQTLMCGSLAIAQVTYASPASVEAASLDNLEALVAGWSARSADGFPSTDYLSE
ncbi:TetR family transcriptional regulator [Salipiger mangrovisoli]|uniref:TetR family transcriptional regulator n=1 Tax=Salipiger mangrovisoli TaxID=2865933 RepID=A0ABR9X931_9RHOB|nr:TetR family transcriptional regulator [Salipiger mangrovisoli]MBE9640047.1 TetR family transcriptional regulator [Salipiger mangrovisoli]